MSETTSKLFTPQSHGDSAPANPEDFLSVFNNDAKWKHNKGVWVFDEHPEVYQVKTPDGQVAQQTETFDKPRLERIAARCNARVAMGCPPPLTRGHTSDTGDESAQPLTFGYGHNYRVELMPDRSKYGIQHDEKVIPELYDEYRTYPGRSVERWKPSAEDGGDYFAPVAALRRTPRRPLPPAVAYQRGGHTIVRYSMEYAAMPEEKIEEKIEKPMPPAGAAPPAMPPAAPATPPAAQPALEPSPEDKELFAKLCESHPHLGPMMKKYAESMAPSAPPAMPGAAMPAAPSAPPMQNAAGCPSGTNTMIPGMNQEPAKMSADNADVVRYQQENDELRQRVSQLEQDRLLERYAAEFRRMADVEGFPIDPAKEIFRCQAYSEDQIKYHMDLIREYGTNSRLPVGPGVRADGSPAPAMNGKAKQFESKEQVEAAIRYQAEKKCSASEARDHVLAPVR